MIIDCHMHTPLCGHARGLPVEYVRQAAQSGIHLITFTCHIPMSHIGFGGPEIRMDRKQLPRYFKMIERAAKAGERLGVKVLCGIEAEVFPDLVLMDEMDEILREYNFDFVLGSLHHHMPVYQHWLYEEEILKDYDIIETYFYHLIEGVRSGRYHSMAHPDVIRIYGTVKFFNPRQHETTVRKFLAALVAQDICMEVNTSGLMKGIYEVHPDPLILDWALEMGVKLTIGSDAHIPQSVGQMYEVVLPMLKAKGFTRLYYYQKGVRLSTPIATIKRSV